MAGMMKTGLPVAGVVTFDLAQQPLRELNRLLHQGAANLKQVRVMNPDGAHNIAVGVNAAVDIEVMGHAGYYCAGMNQLANITVLGNVGPGVAEGMTSGLVHVQGYASVAAGAGSASNSA